MARVYAGTITTEMVGLKTWRDSTDQALISESVSVDGFARTITSAAYAKETIATMRGSGSPYPTTVGENMDFRPEALRNGKLGVHRKFSFRCHAAGRHLRCSRFYYISR